MTIIVICYQTIPRTDPQAIQKLTEMKGIGPATASAVLSFGCLEGQCPFLSDEAMYAFRIVNKSKGTLDYTLASWEALKKACDAKVEELNRQQIGEDEAHVWTPVMIERALWAAAVRG